MYGPERQELKRKMRAKPYNKEERTEEEGVVKKIDQKKGGTQAIVSLGQGF